MCTKSQLCSYLPFIPDPEPDPDLSPKPDPDRNPEPDPDTVMYANKNNNLNCT